MGRLIDEDSLKFTNFEIVMCEGDFRKAFKLLCEKLDNAPTVDAEPVRHGRWEKVYGDHISMGLRPWVVCCSECGKVGTESNYCPECGAKMDKE